MKNISTSIIVFITVLFNSVNVNAQFSVPNQLLGTWESAPDVDGNIFRLEFFGNGPNKAVQGHFMMIHKDILGDETIVYTSNKVIHPDLNVMYNPAISLGASDDPNILEGRISDNTVPNRFKVSGRFTFELLSEDPLEARWKVSPGRGINVIGYNNYNIPTNILMTKVQ